MSRKEPDRYFQRPDAVSNILLIFAPPDRRHCICRTSGVLRHIPVQFTLRETGRIIEKLNIAKQMKTKLIRDKYLLPVICAAALLLPSGCSKDAEYTAMQENQYIDMVFTEAAPDTKAETGEDGSGTFSEGDRVGLYIYGNPTRHMVLTMTDGQWTPRLKKSDLGTGTVRLSAYYPVSGDVQPETNTHKHKVDTDQSGEGYGDSDLLWCHRDIDQEDLAGNRIEMQFRHGMHRLLINISGTDGSLPQDLTVKVINNTEGSFSLYEGIANDPSGTLERISPRKLADEGKYAAVLFPGELKEYSDGWVEITSGGRTSTYRAPETIGKSRSLESGKETVLNLLLKADGDIGTDPDDPGTGLEPDPEYAGKTCWIYGIKTPDTPDYPRDNEESVPEFEFLTPEKFPSGIWFNVSSTIYLNWQEGFLWYDCDKNNPEEGGGSRPGYQDSDMCWAATASNLLHWWMTMNRPYIDAYDKKYGSDPWPEYPRPSPAFSGEKSSEIFDFFRETCRNRGGSATAGINWFINATPGIPAKDYSVYDNFGGYFTDIFKGIPVATSYGGGLDKASFNMTVKTALEKRQGLGFIRSNLNRPSTHVMTIWGAEFDDQGYVSAIYYVDNNDHYQFEVTGGGNNFQHHRLIRQIIRYREGIWKILLGNSDIYPIADLVTVDLRRDVWQTEFPEIDMTDK